MPDGSGPSLGEMGISTVKKSAKVVQQAANPFIQGAKQQITGAPPQPVPPSEAAKTAPKPVQPTSKPPAEGTVFDIFSQVKQQVTGTQQQASGQASAAMPGSKPPAQGGTVFTPPTPTKAPNENLFGAGTGGSSPFEQNPFGTFQKPNTVKTASQVPQISEAEKEKKRQEEKQKLESLRKQLFDAYKQEFIEKSEGKKQQGEETLEQRKKREEQEEAQEEQKKQQEEQKMEFIAPPSSTSKMPGIGQKKSKNSLMNLLRPKQGSKEGRASKG